MRLTLDTIRGVPLTRERSVVVRFTEPGSADFVTLTHELDAELEARYPGLGDDEAPAGDGLVAALVVYTGDTPVGCGALREPEPGIGEITRMFVLASARRQGIARQILEALEARARRSGYSAVRLGTGIRQPEALALYESAGYRRATQFGEYAGTDQCVCYEKAL
jgi:putative acetyltransferase